MLHIEFIGVPGSGKSAISESMVNVLQSHKQLTCLTSDKAFFEVSRQKTDRLYRTVLNLLPHEFAKVFSEKLMNRSLMQFEAQNVFLAKYGTSLLAYLSSDGFTNVGINDRKNSISFFLNAGSTFEVISNNLPGRTVFYSEGFIQKSFMFLHPDLKCPPNQGLVEKYLKSIPHPDLLIFVKVPPEICLVRMKSRPRGLPLRLKEVKESEVLNFLNRAEKHLTTVVEYLNQYYSVKTIEVDNSMTMEDTVARANELFCEYFNL